MYFLWLSKGIAQPDGNKIETDDWNQSYNITHLENLKQGRKSIETLYIAPEICVIIFIFRWRLLKMETTHGMQVRVKRDIGLLYETLSLLSSVSSQNALKMHHVHLRVPLG